MHRLAHTAPAALISSAALAVLIGLAMFLMPVHSSMAQGEGQQVINGWAWSDTVGWISLYGPGYGVSVQADNTVTGWAWSNTIGWIKFGGLSGFPSGSGTQAVNAQFNSSGQLVGWARACGATANGDCTGTLAAEGGGWDGWIALGGDWSQGVSVGADGRFSGFAWGSTVVGWVDFSLARLSTPPPTLSITANNAPWSITVRPGSAVTIRWSSAGVTAGSCVVDNSGDNTTWTGDNDSAGKGTPKLAASRVYRLTCENPAGGMEQTSVSVVVGDVRTPPTIEAFYADPDRVRSGLTTTLYWRVAGRPGLCTIKGTNGFSVTVSSGAHEGAGEHAEGYNGPPRSIATSEITGQTVFTLDCEGVTAQTSVGIIPIFREI